MKKTFISLLAVLILFSSCAHYYYAPNTANVPLLKEKKDMRINAGFSGGDEFEGADLQFAYAVSPHLGVMVNGLFGGKTEDDGYGGVQSGKGSYGELGVGYFTPFTERKLFVFEVYGGAGIGETHHQYGSPNVTSKVSATKFFIQPSIGYTAKKGRFELALGSRFSGVTFKVKEMRNLVHEDINTYYEDLDYVRNRPFSMMWEPSVRVSMGSKDVKFYFSFTRSINLSNSLFEQEPYNASMGIRLTVNAGKKH